MRPKLPVAARLAPYLEKIDGNRVYSNFGPLLRGFEERLARGFGAESDQVAVLANATLALGLVLQAVRLKGKKCLMPSWTFVATAHAALAAGLEPYFVDVDPSTWTLDARRVEHVASAMRGEIGAVVAVAPFGAPLDVASWAEFRRTTGIPVVLDCAAGFDTVRLSDVPTVLSLHATKAMGIGEGAVVLCGDRALVAETTRRANFGFLGRRVAEVVAINAKMSEYQAAVGHAALDEWPSTRARLMGLADAFRRRFGAGPVAMQAGFGIDWISSTCVVRLSGEAVHSAARRLEAKGIETRSWWQRGAHCHPPFAGFGREPLPVTEVLADATLGLPFYVDLTESEIAEICAALDKSAPA